MNAVIYNPLEDYEKRLRTLHIEKTSQHLDALVKQSGVDVEQNRQTVNLYNQYKENLVKLKKKLTWLKVLRVFMCITLVLIPLVILKTTPRIKALKAEIEEADKKAEELLAEAHHQMLPLNNLFTDRDALNLIEAVMPLLSFDEPEAKSMPVFFASSCFTQDWDALLESINAVPLPDFSERFNVESWGHIYPKFDINFIKQLRNAIAHSKFDYDFDNDRIYISTYKDTFKVNFTSDILLGTPKTLWNINKNSTSPSAWVDCSFILDGVTDPNLYTFFMRNGQTAHSTVLEELGTTDITQIPLQERLQIFEKYAVKLMKNERTKSGESAVKSLSKLATQCGLSLEYKGKHNIFKQTFKNNAFLEKMAYIVYHNNEKGLDELFLRGAVMRPEKKFMGNPFFHTLVTCAFNNANNSTAKNVSIITENHAPFYLREMRDYAEESYLNYVFNYLLTKIELDNETKNSHSIVDGKTKSELASHIRNAIVHPGRIKKQDNYYLVRDYNRKGECTLNETISVNKLLDFADSIVTQMKAEVSSMRHEENEKE